MDLFLITFFFRCDFWTQTSMCSWICMPYLGHDLFYYHWLPRYLMLPQVFPCSHRSLCQNTFSSLYFCGRKFIVFSQCLLYSVFAFSISVCWRSLHLWYRAYVHLWVWALANMLVEQCLISTISWMWGVGEGGQIYQCFLSGGGDCCWLYFLYCYLMPYLFLQCSSLSGLYWGVQSLWFLWTGPNLVLTRSVPRTRIDAVDMVTTLVIWLLQVGSLCLIWMLWWIFPFPRILSVVVSIEWHM